MIALHGFSPQSGFCFMSMLILIEERYTVHLALHFNWTNVYVLCTFCLFLDRVRLVPSQSMQSTSSITGGGGSGGQSHKSTSSSSALNHV